MKGTLFVMIAVVGVVGVVDIALWRAPDNATQERAVASPYAPECVAANGVVEGRRPEIPLRFEVPGRIVALPVKESQEVARGTLLGELNNETHKHQVALAASDVAHARADLDKIINGERKEKRDAVRALEEAKKILWQNAVADFNRAQELFNKRAVSREEFDRALYRKDQYEAEWKSAKAELELIEAPARREDVAAAQARLAAAESRLRLAGEELAKTKLIAPSHGKILQIFAEPGEMTTASSPQPVMILADLSARRVRAFIEELDFARVQLGQKAAVTVDGLPDRTFAGKVVEMLPRMGKRAPHSDAPEEYKDLYFREVMIELENAQNLPINLRVQVKIFAP
jgi:HlyD family secretion protein